MQDLCRIKPISAAAAAVPILTRLIQTDPDEDVRQQAAHTLSYLPPTDSSIEVLSEALNDQNHWLRRSAAQAIPVHEKYLPQIIAGLSNSDREVRHTMVAKFTNIPPFRNASGERVRGKLAMSDSSSEQAFSALTAALSDSSQDVRISTCFALANIDKGAKAAVSLIALLNGADSNMRITACRALAHIGQDAKEAGPALVQLLKLDVSTRYEAAKALVQTGGARQADLPILTDRLRTDSDHPILHTRSYCAQIIGQLGDEAKDAVPDLIYAVEHDNEPQVRECAIEALGRIGAAARLAIPAIIHFLKNRAADNKRYRAAEALGVIAEPDNQLVIDALKDALQDRNEEVQRSSIKAVSNLGTTTPAVIEALKRVRFAAGSQAENDLMALRQKLSIPEDEMAMIAVTEVTEDPWASKLRDEDRVVRRSALEELLYRGPKVVDTSLVPDLVAILQAKDEDIFSRTYAAELLGKAGHAARSAVGVLIGSLHRSDEDNVCHLKSSAIDALMSIAPDDPAVLNALVLELLKDGSYSVSGSAATALARLGKNGIPYLLLALDSNERRVIYNGARALGSLGETAKEAVPPLLRVLGIRHLLSVQHLPTCGGGDGSGAVPAALASIAPNDKDVLDALIVVSQDDDFRARKGAARALREIGSPRALDAAARAEKLDAIAWAASEIEGKITKVVRAAKQGCSIHVQIVEIIGQYALSGFPATGVTWQEACAKAMQENNITLEEVEAEVHRSRTSS